MDCSVLYFIWGIQTAVSFRDQKIILSSFIAYWISSDNFLFEYKSLCRAQESPRIQCRLSFIITSIQNVAQTKTCSPNCCFPLSLPPSPCANMLLIHNQLFARLWIFTTGAENQAQFAKRVVKETWNVRVERQIHGRQSDDRTEWERGRMSETERRDDVLNGICRLPSEQAAATDPGSWH